MTSDICTALSPAEKARLARNATGRHDDVFPPMCAVPATPAAAPKRPWADDLNADHLVTDSTSTSRGCISPVIVSA